VIRLIAFLFIILYCRPLRAQEDGAQENNARSEKWSFHLQNTYIVQGDPAFHAQYSGPNSLNSAGEVQETITADFFAGVALWRGAELHADFLVWQGFGLSQTYGIEAFPNGDAYKAGTKDPNYTFAHLFLRQTIGLGGPKEGRSGERQEETPGRAQEETPGDPLTLAGKRDISRLTFTIGRLSPLDICDDNAYARDPHTQFMNWAMMANLTWDYGQNTVGYTTGAALELNQPAWALRYSWFQMPREKNGFTGDDEILTWPRRGAYGPFLRSWAMAAEWEGRYRLHKHPGVIRLLSWLDEADFASYRLATSMLLANPPDLNVGAGSGVTIPEAARGFHHKYGFGANWQQDLDEHVGLFSRLGWNDGHYDTWTFTDADWTASAGVAVKGSAWRRPGDCWGFAAILTGASRDNQRFLAAGGTDMLDGDGALNYRPEQALETYYDFRLWRTLHAAVDYQFVANPAFNHARGPVCIFGCRLHWEL
jgi:high affinity Mn2+ porin